MSENNIKSAFHAAELVLFNQHKVLVHMPNFEEKDCELSYDLNNDLETSVVKP